MSSQNTVDQPIDAVMPVFGVVAILNPTGDIDTLNPVLRSLPADFPAAIIIMQPFDGLSHQAASFLMKQTVLPLEWAAQPTPIKPGRILVCSPRYVSMRQPDGTVILQPRADGSDEQPIDRFLESLAQSYGKHALALVLAKVDDDGKTGVQALKAAGGTVIIQTETSSQDGHMVSMVVATGGIDLLFPLHEIGAMLTYIITQKRLPPVLTTVPGVASVNAEQILENIDMFYVVDENFQLTYLNRKAEEAWGRRREDLIGKHYWTEFPAAVGSESYHMHLKAMEERLVVHYETISPLLHRWVDVSIYPTVDGGLAVYFYDIQERKRRELNADFLVEIDRDLAYLMDESKILEAISDKIVRHFGLARLVYNRIDLSGNRAVSFYEKHDSDLSSGLNDYRISDFISEDCIHTLSTGELIAIDDVATDPRTLALADAYDAYEVRSQILAPHLIKGEWRFLVSALRREPYRWRADEIEVMRELTARISLWLERTDAEKALRESEAWLRVAMNGARLGAWEWDPILDTSKADARSRELLGITMDEPISVTALLQERVVPQDRAAVEAALTAALNPQGTGWYDIAYRIILPGSEERWLHFTGQTSFEGLGAERHAVRMFGTVRDVTETKRAEAAQQQLSAELAWQGRRFDAIASTAEDAIYTFDPSGRFTYANRRLLDIWQKTPEQSFGKTLLELNYPPEEAARITRQIEQVVATRQPLRDESITLDFAGATAAYEYIFTPIINADGTIEGVAGIARDTTERTRTETALRESEERYRTLFESIDEGFCIIEVIFDADDKPVDYLFLETNPAFVGQTGLVSAVGKRMRELVPGHEAHWFEIYGRVTRTGKPERFVNEAKQLGRWYDVYAFPYGEGLVGVLFNDITQRKQTEEALRESEQRFRRALEIETVGVIFLESEGGITNTNDAFLSMSGFSREDVEVGLLRWDTLTPEEWMPATLKAREEFITLGRTTPYEKQYYRKDGSRWWGVFAAKRLSENEGIEFILDITQRKEMELTLRETEERVRLILDSAKDYAIYAFDMQGQFISWNTGAERIFGYTEEEVVGQHHRLIYTVEDRILGIPEREMQKALALGYSENERWHICKDGHPIYGSGMVRPLRDTDGTLKGFTKVMRDETDRKFAEQRMQMLQQLAADLSARVTVQDMGKSILQTSRRAVSGTRASLYLLNSEDQLLERFSDNSSGPIQTNYVRISLDMPAPLTDAIRTRQIVWGSSQEEYISRYPLLKDDIILSNIHAFIALPLVLEENILGGIAIAFSQTKVLSREEHEFLIAVAHLCAQALERARLYETEREAREAAEKANQLKMQFLGMISHELRTPLASIKGYTTTLLATDVTFTLEEQREFLGVVNEETDKLTDLVVQLLDLTRLQAGNLRIDLSPHTLKDVLSVAQTQLHTLTLQHDLVVDLPNDLPTVLADDRRIAQVLVNLVGNAVKFSPPKTPITIQASHNQASVQVDVSDEGLGIPPEYRTEVFEAFRQVERLNVSHDPGAGLGLAICKGIIEAHGGQIWVQDRNRGTTISFTLPVVQEDIP